MIEKSSIRIILTRTIEKGEPNFSFFSTLGKNVHLKMKRKTMELNPILEGKVKFNSLMELLESVLEENERMIAEIILSNDKEEESLYYCGEAMSNDLDS